MRHIERFSPGPTTVSLTGQVRAIIRKQAATATARYTMKIPALSGDGIRGETHLPRVGPMGAFSAISRPSPWKTVPSRVPDGSVLRIDAAVTIQAGIPLFHRHLFDRQNGRRRHLSHPEALPDAFRRGPAFTYHGETDP